MRSLVRLTELDPGRTAQVSGFADDSLPETTARFRALGFVVGSEVLVERRLPFGGPIVVRLGGGAFALDQDAAASVLVTKGA
jgi:Fe2+ transport system protein FeoA